MFAILLIALCVVTTHAQYNSRFSCPPDGVASRQFRMMTGQLQTNEIPTMAQAEEDMERAPDEIKELVKDSLSEALSFKARFELLIRPFVYRCCQKPEYKCTSVNIPLRFIWYYYYYQFCFVIYPAGEKTIYYNKCTCMTCVRDSYCPLIGRCVETDYTYHYIIVYCPKLYYGHRYKILLVAVPKDCKCMTYCPNSYYGYSYSRNSLESAVHSDAASRPVRQPSAEDEANQGTEEGTSAK